MNDENEEWSLRAIEIIDSYSDYSAMLNIKKRLALVAWKNHKSQFRLIGKTVVKLGI